MFAATYNKGIIFRFLYVSITVSFIQDLRRRFNANKFKK